MIIVDLSDGLDSLPESAVDENPGQQEAAGQLPPDVSHLVDPLRDLEHEVTEKSASRDLERKPKKLTGRIRRMASLHLLPLL